MSFISPALSRLSASASHIRPTAKVTTPYQQASASLAGRLKAGIQKQVRDEPLLFWIGLMGVPAAILTPITTYQDLKRRTVISPQERHLLVTQEVLRQTISALTHFVSYYGSILLIGLQLRENAKYRSLKQLLGATVITTLANGIFRPLVTNAFLAKHAQHKQHTLQSTSRKQSFVYPVRNVPKTNTIDTFIGSSS